MKEDFPHQNRSKLAMMLGLGRLICMFCVSLCVTYVFVMCMCVCVCVCAGVSVDVYNVAIYA